MGALAYRFQILCGLGNLDPGLLLGQYGEKLLNPRFCPRRIAETDAEYLGGIKHVGRPRPGCLLFHLYKTSPPYFGAFIAV
jgi:hypothetical protein